MRRESHYQAGERTYTVVAEEDEAGWTITIDGQAHAVIARAGERGRLALEIDGRRQLAHVARAGAQTWVHVDGEMWALERVSATRPRVAASSAAGGPLLATMPGRVLDVLVQQGAAVTKGQTLVLLEAMKMELRIAAPADGVVRTVHVEAGRVIERGAALVEIETA